MPCFLHILFRRNNARALIEVAQTKPLKIHILSRFELRLQLPWENAFLDMIRTRETDGIFGFLASKSSIFAIITFLLKTVECHKMMIEKKITFHSGYSTIPPPSRGVKNVKIQEKMNKSGDPNLI